MATLEIKDLHVEVEDKDKKSRKKILKGVNLSLKTGEINYGKSPLPCYSRRYSVK